jgi:hypothetical protein
LVAFAVVAYAVGVPLLGGLRRARRRAGATTPTARVLVAWDEAGEDLARAGLGRLPAETAPEYARRLDIVSPETSGALAALAADLSAAAFSASGVSDDAAARAEAAAGAVKVELRASASPLRRALWALDPRPLVGDAGRWARQRVTGGVGAARRKRGSGAGQPA